MSEQTPPYPYFNGIIYNQSLFGGQSGQYLPRTGVATSVATSTTFNGIVYTSGLTDSSTISATNLSVSGTITLPANSILDTALSTNVALKNGNNTFINAVNAPSFSGNLSPTNSLGTISGLTNNTIVYNSPTNHVFQVSGTEIARITNTTTNFTRAITSTGIIASGINSGLGYVDLQPGLTDHSGYVEFKTNNGTRLGTIGYAQYNNTTQSGLGNLLIYAESGTPAIEINKLSVSGTLTLPANSILDSALSTNVALLNASNIFTGTTNTFTGSGINITNGVGGGSGGINIQQTNTVSQTIQWVNSGGFAQANIYASSLSNVLSFDITSLLTNGIRFTLAGVILMTLSTTGLMTLLTSPAFSYTTLPTLSSSQIGYSVPITVNSPGSNVANQYYLIATITNMPIGVFIINSTTYTSPASLGLSIGISTSSSATPNSYIHYANFVSGSMNTYYHVFSNTSVRTIYIMGTCAVAANFQTNYGNDCVSCVRIA
jgi:hypothetical protein